MSVDEAHRRGPIGIRRIGLLAPVLIILSSSAVACGRDVERAGTAPVTAPPAATREAPATAPATTTVPATATGPTATSGVPPQGGSGGTTAPAESQPGGAGDEEPVRVPAAFAIDGAKVTPARVSVPAFLAIEVRLTSRDGRPHDVRIEAPGGGTVRLAAGGTAVRRLPGAPAGAYPIVVDGATRAVLRVGVVPEP